jgi:leader peptidase (prepilin peptidase)/N-methyltransferase
VTRTAIIVGFGFLLGLCVGSFLNVAIYRLPRGLSVSSPPSACPACGHPIRWRDNVPVLSWLLLKGRCRDCRGTVSVRYPLVELGTGLVGATIALTVSWLTSGSPSAG